MGKYMILKLNNRHKYITNCFIYDSLIITGMNDEYLCIERKCDNRDCGYFLLPLNDNNILYYWKKQNPYNPYVYLYEFDGYSWHYINTDNDNRIKDIYHSIFNSVRFNS